MLNNIRYDPTFEEYLYKYLNWICETGDKLINKIMYNYDINDINKKLDNKNIIFYEDNEYDGYSVTNLL